MTLKKRTKIVQSKNAHTQYLIIPSATVRDSQYPFQRVKEVEIIVDPKKKRIVVKPVKK